MHSQSLVRSWLLMMSAHLANVPSSIKHVTGCWGYDRVRIIFQNRDFWVPNFRFDEINEGILGVLCIHRTLATGISKFEWCFNQFKIIITVHVVCINDKYETIIGWWGVKILPLIHYLNMRPVSLVFIHVRISNRKNVSLLVLDFVTWQQNVEALA